MFWLIVSACLIVVIIVLLVICARVLSDNLRLLAKLSNADYENRLAGDEIERLKMRLSGEQAIRESRAKTRTGCDPLP